MSPDRRLPPRRPRSRPRSDAELENLLTRADTAADGAAVARAHWRKRTHPRATERVIALRREVARLNVVSKGLRQELGRSVFDRGLEQQFGERLRLASARVQWERKKLWKMLPRPNR